jgi:bifunctional UDP-N-acetylglucosamine pyrophosphorylase/glucosamine-1-phosphate N-acetyltransferase
MWWREIAEQAQSTGAPRDAADSALHIDPAADVSESAILNAKNGPISIGARTRICPGAYLEGPLEIGEDCLVGNLAIVRGPARIGNGTRIGFAAEIKNAIIEQKVTIGPQCFVADSKIESGAYLGAQVRTSNHRLDRQTVSVFEDGERIDTGLEKLGCLIGAGAALGIQVIILPGRVVAPGSIFAPRVTIEKNLPPGRYRPAQQLESF